MENNDLNILLNIDSKVDDVRDRIHSIELTQTRMESDLKYHIKRTDLLEEKIFEIDDKMKPVENARTAAYGVAKIVAFIIAAIGAIVGLLRSFK
jgi:hypothetical protein